MTLKLFLCGDVMTGRGIDQIFPRSCPSKIHESFLNDARDYVQLAEMQNGPIPRKVDSAYIWGDAMAALKEFSPDVKIINLETSITLSESWEDKGINYRMHPDNVDCLRAAQVNCCALANNHVLDWGQGGLIDTIAALDRAAIRHAGAGVNREAAAAPAVLPCGDAGRVLVWSLGFASSGVPKDWMASFKQAGVWYFDNLSKHALKEIGDQVHQMKRQGDLAVLSIHWGPNWGYEISDREIAFAHALIDESGIDLVHGHSSHHPKAMEVHHGKLILYGCGDLINDYEGISGYEEFRGDLGLMYFPTLDMESGRLTELFAVPTQMKRFQLKTPSPADIDWLEKTWGRECKQFGLNVSATSGRLYVEW